MIQFIYIVVKMKSKEYFRSLKISSYEKTILLNYSNKKLNIQYDTKCKRYMHPNILFCLERNDFYTVKELMLKEFYN